MVGVTGSIPVAPTIKINDLPLRRTASVFIDSTLIAPKWVLGQIARSNNVLQAL